MSPASENLNDIEGAANAHTNVLEVFARSCGLRGVHADLSILAAATPLQVSQVLGHTNVKSRPAPS